MNFLTFVNSSIIKSQSFFPEQPNINQFEIDLEIIIFLEALFQPVLILLNVIASSFEQFVMGVPGDGVVK